MAIQYLGVLFGVLVCATAGSLVSRYSERFNRTGVSMVVAIGVATLILSALLLVEGRGLGGLLTLWR